MLILELRITRPWILWRISNDLRNFKLPSDIDNDSDDYVEDGDLWPKETKLGDSTSFDEKTDLEEESDGKKVGPMLDHIMLKKSRRVWSNTICTQKGYVQTMQG